MAVTGALARFVSADTVDVMTARPGRIKKRISVELPRPRSLEITTSPPFNEIKRGVLPRIREEALRAAAGELYEARLG